MPITNQTWWMLLKLDATGKLLIYPNPTDGLLTFRFIILQVPNIKLNIADLVRQNNFYTEYERGRG